MGACASLPKGMRGEAPPPEPAKEESVQADQQHTPEEVIKVEKEENKANEVDESKQQSLGFLLDEPEKVDGKKEPNEAQKAQVEASEEPKKEEPKPEPKSEETKVETQKEEAEKGEQKKDDAKKEEEAKVEPKKEEPKKTEAPIVQNVTEEDKEKKSEEAKENHQ